MTIFNKIKKILPIELVAQEFAKLSPDGSYLKGDCPLCKEEVLSFVISIEKQIFYCFSCNKGGDLITFAGFMNNLSQIDAALWLIDEYLKLELNDDVKKQESNE